MINDDDDNRGLDDVNEDINKDDLDRFWEELYIFVENKRDGIIPFAEHEEDDDDDDKEEYMTVE